MPSAQVHPPASRKNFELASKTSNSKSFMFLTPVIDMIQEDGYTRLTTPEKGSTVEDGMPELPVFTSYFQMTMVLYFALILYFG